MTRLTRFSLANRTVILLLALLVVATGVAATLGLKQELVPSSDQPSSTIISVYPGASPATVETEVTKPIEDAVQAVDDVTSVESVSSSNTSQVVVEWEWGEDSDQIMSDLRAAVDGVELPDTVDPTVNSGSFDDVPVVIVAVSSDMGAAELSRQAEDVMVPALKEVEGVQDVTIAGDEEREIDITFDVAKTNELGVDPSSIEQLFAANSKTFPSGTMRTDTAEIDVQTGRTYESVEQVADLEVQGEDGRVRLGDIATVEELPTPLSTVSRVNGRDAVTLSVTKESDANTVTVSHAVDEELQRLKEEIGSDTEFNAVLDQAPFIEQSIHDLSVEGGIGLLMAVLVILLFLRSLAPTFVTGLSIPLSLLVAMVGLYVGGYTLNIFTLGALTVAIGRVVDDSIVVIENIKRHQALGESGPGTLLRSVREVAGAVTSSTLTTVAVFAPIGLVGGQAGEFFRPFALTVVVSLLASLLVSLTVVPVLASYVMQRRTTRAAIAEQAHDEADGWLQRAYLPVLDWTLGHRLITLTLAILIFAGTMAMAPFLKTDFLGAATAQNLQIVQTMPTGTSLAETDAAVRRVEQVIARQPDLGTYSADIGGGGGNVFDAERKESNEATINVTLDPGADPLTSANRLRTALKQLGGVGRTEVIVGNRDSGSTVELVIESPDSDRLAGAAAQATRMLEGIKGLTNISSDLDDERQMLDVDVNDVRAAELGMTQASVGQAVSWAVRGQKIGEMTIDDTTLEVYLRTQEPAEQLEEIRGIVLPVTQKMTADAREDASDALEARSDAFEEEQEDDAEDDFEDSIEDMQEQREESEDSADEFAEQLDAARARLATLQARRQANPNSPNITQLDQDIDDAQARVSQLSQSQSGADEGADSIDDQIDEARDQWDEQQDTQDESDELADAGDAIDDIRGTAVRVHEVADVSMIAAASSITRVDGARAVTVTASADGADVGAVTAQIEAGLAKTVLGQGVTARIGGVSAEQEESFGQLFLAMGVAIAIVYLIMVATFRSLVQPMILLVSIPFAATGALGLSLLTDTALGIPSMIGLLMLIGIVVTNAIVLIDLINQKRADGGTVEESIMAGARLRVRPIIMTALATICALLPMALGITGGGIFISKPLAIVVIGGLVSSSLLTLILVPVLYDLVEHRPHWMRLAGADQTGTELDDPVAGSHRREEAEVHS